MAGSCEKWLVIGVVVLNAYNLGASCVERFVNYQSWTSLAGADFGPYHRSQQPYILGFVVGPLGLALALQILLLLYRPHNVSPWIPLMLIGASVAGFVSTLAIQIPIHRQLDSGYSQELVTGLLATDWIRKSADLIRLVGTIALLQQTLS